MNNVYHAFSYDHRAEISATKQQLYNFIYIYIECFFGLFNVD